MNPVREARMLEDVGKLRKCACNLLESHACCKHFERALVRAFNGALIGECLLPEHRTYEYTSCRKLIPINNKCMY